MNKEERVKNLKEEIEEKLKEVTTLKELKEEAKELGIKGYSKLNKEELEKEINDKKEEK